VCRDYAHLVIAFLRAHDVPARLVSAYAPGLSPMDFHAVVDVGLDDAWQVVDATGLAPRQSLMRIATGRDAADTAFLSSAGAAVLLNVLAVTAVADELPRDDITLPARLG
jgi:transglutaminase-like putative cysteine protease